MPGVPRSTMNAEMPFGAGGAIGDRHHHQHVADAAVGDEGLRAVQHPARRRRASAVVRMPAASLPEVDSVRPQAPIFSPRASGTRYVCFCASVPNIEDVRGAQAVVRGDRQRDAGIDARQLLDADAVVDRPTSPAPPYSSGNWMPSSPSAASFGHQLASESAAPRPTRGRAAGSRFRRTRGRCAAAAPALRSAGNPLPV